MNEQMKAQMVAAFTEWERRWRDDPDQFMSDQERLSRGAATLGEQRTEYLLELMGETDE